MELGEEDVEPEHPGTLCRLCGNHLETAESTFIFGEDGEKKSLAEKINACLPVSVSSNVHK